MTANLADRETKIVTELYESFKNIMVQVTEPIDSSASPGQAAYQSTAIDSLVRQQVRLVEDLLQITRHMRELWIVGPLQAAEGREKAAQASVDRDAVKTLEMLNVLRTRARQALVRDAGGLIEYAVETAEEATPTASGIQTTTVLPLGKPAPSKTTDGEKQAQLSP